MGIDIVNRQRLVHIQREELAEVVRRTLAAIGCRECSVTVAFVRDLTIRKLNRDFRGSDRETDVLSFPAAQRKKPGTATKKARRQGPIRAAVGSVEDNYIGDVVISTDTALRQAKRSGLSTKRELSELMIHGVLHLCGYDHDSDRGEMNRLELKLRQKLLDD